MVPIKTGLRYPLLRHVSKIEDVELVGREV